MVALLRLAFATAPEFQFLNLATHRNSPARSTKSTTSHFLVVLCLLVSIGFQVLFHSPPGVLFTFPSRYYTLSVTKSNLALGDGPPVFPLDFSCPVVLWIPSARFRFRLRGCYSVSPSFPTVFNYKNRYIIGSVTLLYITIQKFGLFPVRSPLLRKSIVFFLFLRVLRCFSSPGSPPYTMDSCMVTYALPYVSSLIRKSTDQSSFATPRGLSQLVTSFIGAWCQGIRPTPLLA